MKKIKEETPEKKKIASKRKSDDDPISTFLMEKIKEKHEKKIDPDESFCLSLVATLKHFTPKQNRMARIKIEQVLFDIKFED